MQLLRVHKTPGHIRSFNFKLNFTSSHVFYNCESSTVNHLRAMPSTRFTESTVQRPSSSRQLRRHTEPIMSAIGPRKETTKRKFEESPERVGKRRRTSPSPLAPSEGFRRPLSWPPSRTFLTAEDAGTLTPTSASASASASVSTGTKAEKKRSRKRKSEETEGPRKRSRMTPSPSEALSHQTTTEASFSEEPGTSSSENTNPHNSIGTFLTAEDAGTLKPDSACTSACTSTSAIVNVNINISVNIKINVNTGTKAEEKKRRKRKSEETEGPRKRSRKRSKMTPSPSEALSHQTTTEASFSEKPGTSSSKNTNPHNSIDAFVAKYKEEEFLGEGAYGSVFAGYRKDDNLPVAIKHIRKFGNAKMARKKGMIPTEVALLLHLQPAVGETSAVVGLLDWYDLDKKLIVVLERPVPCMDLRDYMDSKEFNLQEHEIKNIAKQLVDVLHEVHSKGVFHRDISLENILIETGSDVPRVRLIDFGGGRFLSKEEDSKANRTFGADAESTTVWQLGLVLYEMVFEDCSNLRNLYEFSCEDHDGPSSDCRDFLRSCLEQTPEDQLTLESLKQHPWLV